MQTMTIIAAQRKQNSDLRNLRLSSIPVLAVWPCLQDLASHSDPQGEGRPPAWHPVGILRRLVPQRQLPNNRSYRVMCQLYASPD